MPPDVSSPRTLDLFDYTITVPTTAGESAVASVKRSALASLSDAELAQQLGQFVEEVQRYCQVDVKWTKLVRGEPSGRSKLLYQGSTRRIAPSGKGVITRSPVLTGRQAMSEKLKVVVDRAMG